MGGGQLGRMFVHAAQQMGYFTAVLDPDPDSPAGLRQPPPHRHRLPGPGRPGRGWPPVAAAITTEFENVPAQALQPLAASARWRPPAAAVAIAQDRAREKAHFAALRRGLRAVTPSSKLPRPNWPPCRASCCPAS